MPTAMTVSVYLLDVNVLIALAWPQHVHHARSHAWFDSLAGQWATTPVTEAGYLRLTMNPAVVGTTVRASEALASLSALRASAGHVFLVDNSSLADPRIDLSRVASYRQITDAHLVNLAAMSGAVLATLDRGIRELVPAEQQGGIFLLPR